MTIHDHFDGSAHCVECAGNCRLEGDDRAATNLVRAIFEYMAYLSRLSVLSRTSLIGSALVSLGVDVPNFSRRATDTILAQLSAARTETGPAAGRRRRQRPSCLPNRSEIVPSGRLD